jgi:[CysO sulfur-carrier protein]-S-L-cysteine hydrolase
VKRAPLLVDAAVRGAMLDHAADSRPLECCGLLLGRGRHVRFAVPLRNTASSRVRFRLDDRAHLELRRLLRGFRPVLEIVGVYHSHPAGRAWPSDSDIAEAHYPDWAFVVVGLAGRPRVAAFRIQKGRAHPWAIRWTGTSGRPGLPR